MLKIVLRERTRIILKMMIMCVLEMIAYFLLTRVERPLTMYKEVMCHLLTGYYQARCQITALNNLALNFSLLVGHCRDLMLRHVSCSLAIMARSLECLFVVSYSQSSLGICCASTLVSYT
jgi:hypothetical protein